MKRVYAFEMASGIVKIGISQDVAQRMQQVAYALKEKVVNFHFTEFAPRAVAIKIERDCHKTFADRRLFGEFFNITFAEACAELDSYADEIEMANIDATAAEIEHLDQFDEPEENHTSKMTDELNIPASFGRFRKDFKLTKTAVAAALGIQLPSYGYETEGKNNNPNAKTLFKLAKAFNVSTDYLLGLTDDPRPVDEILASQKKPVPSSDEQTAGAIAELKTMLAEQEARLAALESARVAQS